MGIDSKGVTPNTSLNQVTFMDIGVLTEDSMFIMLARRSGQEVTES